MAKWKHLPTTFYKRTSTTVNKFQAMHKELCPYIMQPHHSTLEQLNGHVHKVQLSSKNHILLVLVWMHDYPSYSLLSVLFGVNSVFISHEIHHFIPLICWCFQHEIQWPDAAQQALLKGTFPNISPTTIFSMDFTVQPISEPAKGMEHDFY